MTDVYNTGKGYAFVTFSRKEEATSATQVWTAVNCTINWCHTWWPHKCTGVIGPLNACHGAFLVPLFWGPLSALRKFPGPWAERAGTVMVHPLVSLRLLGWSEQSDAGRLLESPTQQGLVSGDWDLSAGDWCFKRITVNWQFLERSACYENHLILTRRWMELPSMASRSRSMRWAQYSICSKLLI